METERKSLNWIGYHPDSEYPGDDRNAELFEKCRASSDAELLAILSRGPYWESYERLVAYSVALERGLKVSAPPARRTLGIDEDDTDAWR